MLGDARTGEKKKFEQKRKTKTGKSTNNNINLKAEICQKANVRVKSVNIKTQGILLG